MPSDREKPRLTNSHLARFLPPDPAALELQTQTKMDLEVPGFSQSHPSTQKVQIGGHFLSPTHPGVGLRCHGRRRPWPLMGLPQEMLY